jgi:hypothetical protein
LVKSKSSDGLSGSFISLELLQAPEGGGPVDNIYTGINAQSALPATLRRIQELYFIDGHLSPFISYSTPSTTNEGAIALISPSVVSRQAESK